MASGETKSLAFLPPGDQGFRSGSVSDKGARDVIGAIGTGTVVNDPGTTHPVKNKAGRPKGSGVGQGWSEERRAAYEAKRAKEKVVIEDEEEKEPLPYDEAIVAQIAFYIKFAHGSGDWALTDMEAQGLAGALAGVLKYHIRINLKSGGRVGAYLTLLSTAAMVYMPKAMAKAARKKAEADAKAAVQEAMQ